MNTWTWLHLCMIWAQLICLLWWYEWSMLHLSTILLFYYPCLATISYLYRIRPQLHCLDDYLLYLCMIWAQLICLLWRSQWCMHDLNTIMLFTFSFLTWVYCLLLFYVLTWLWFETCTEFSTTTLPWWLPKSYVHDLSTNQLLRFHAFSYVMVCSSCWLPNWCVFKLGGLPCSSGRLQWCLLKKIQNKRRSLCSILQHTRWNKGYKCCNTCCNCCTKH